MADTRLLLGLVLSLLLSSICIAFVTGETSATLGDTTLYRPIQADLTQNQTVPYQIDRLTMGNFESSPDGLRSATPHENTIFFISRFASNDVFMNDYGVYNPQNLEYSIIVRETGLWADSIRVSVNPAGITIHSKSIAGFLQTYNHYTYTDMAQYGNSYTISTILHEPNRTVTVLINDNTVAVGYNIPQDTVFSLLPVKYSGISVRGEGFYLQELQSTGQKVDEQSFDVWTFLSALGGVLGWYTSSGNPVADVFINIIIKIQQFGIIAVVVTIIRGN